MKHSIRLLACFLLFAVSVMTAPQAEAHSRIATPDDDVPSSETKHVSQLSILPGYFHQSEPTYNSSCDYLDQSFGLIDEGRDRWHRLRDDISRSNDEADECTSVKVLVLGRHGEGFHNIAERRYGTPEWDCYWSKQNGDGNLTWGPDALLTDVGIQQAKRVHQVWKRERLAGAPIPSALYSSPLSRAASTCQITFDGLASSPPRFVENLRETLGIHTCDKRHRKSWLNAKFPSFDFLEPFSEQDELWRPDVRETDAEQDSRSRKALEEIFARDSVQFVSITAHGGVIASILRAAGHPPVQTQTGSVTPIVIKAVRPRSSITTDSSVFVPVPRHAASAGAAQLVLEI